MITIPDYFGRTIYLNNVSEFCELGKFNGHDAAIKYEVLKTITRQDFDYKENLKAIKAYASLNDNVKYINYRRICVLYIEKRDILNKRNPNLKQRKTSFKIAFSKLKNNERVE